MGGGGGVIYVSDLTNCGTETKLFHFHGEFKKKLKN